MTKVRLHGRDTVREHPTMFLTGPNRQSLLELAAQLDNAVFITTGGAEVDYARLGLRSIEIDTGEDLLDILACLNEEDNAHLFGGVVQTVVFDNFADIQNNLLLHHTYDSGRETPHFDDWSWLLTYTGRIINSFSGLGRYNTIILGVQPLGESDTVKPGVLGAFSNAMNTHCDYNLYANYRKRSDGEVLTILTKPSWSIPWIYDSFSQLPKDIDTDGERILQRLISGHSGRVAKLNDSVVIDDAPSEEPVQVETGEQYLPTGMGSDEDVAAALQR